MRYKFYVKFKIIIGRSPHGENMIIEKTKNFENMKDLEKWVNSQFKSNNIWWVEYNILKLNPKLKLLRNIKNDNFY